MKTEPSGLSLGWLQLQQALRLLLAYILTSYPSIVNSQVRIHRVNFLSEQPHQPPIDRTCWVKSLRKHSTNTCLFGSGADMKEEILNFKFLPPGLEELASISPISFIKCGCCSGPGKSPFLNVLAACCFR